MASIKPEDIRSEDLRQYQYFYVVGKWGQVVIGKIFSPCILGNGSKTVREILEDIEIYNKKDKKLERAGSAYQKWFTRQELDKIDNDPIENFNITLLYKICLRLWDNKVIEASDTVKTLLKVIKDERNCVSLEDFKLTQNELEAKLQEFHQTLTDVLDEAAKLYQSHKDDFIKTSTEISEDIRNIQQKIRDNLDPLNPEDYEKLKEELESFRDQLRKDILERSRSDLISLYKRLCKIMPLDGLPQYEATGPSEIMVYLEMDADKEMHSNVFGNKPTILDQREILTATKPSGDNAKVVIISGEAGAGKNTLLSCILEEWSSRKTNDFDELSSYDILLRIEFRSYDVDNFDDYLRTHLQHAVADHNFLTVKSSILRSQCLIICDSFDKRNPKSEKLFKQILKLDFNGLKVLVTTRPVLTKTLTKIVSDSRRPKINLGLLGMQEESQYSLVTRMAQYLIKDDEPRRKNLVDEITKLFHSMQPEMKDLLKNPLYMNLFVLLLIKCPELKNFAITTTKLFIELMNDKSRRLVEELKITDKEKVLEFQKFYNQQCLRCHLQQRYDISEDETEQFRNLCNKIDLPFDDVMPTYFSIKHAVKSLEIETVYCFKHHTEQEFGAASAICDGIVSIYKDASDSVHQDTENAGNIISRIIKDIKKQMKKEDGSEEEEEETPSDDDEEESEESSSNEDDETDKKDIQIILTFISGILYNKHNALLKDVAKDILQLIHQEYENNGGLIIDPYLHHISETEKNSSISSEVITILKAEFEKRWTVTDGKNLSLIPELISQIKPTELTVELYTDPNTHPDLLSTIQSCNENHVGLKLHLNNHFWGQVNDTSDPWFKEGRKTLLSFRGTLSSNTIKDSLQEAQDITKLDLQLKAMDLLQDVSHHLLSLNALTDLRLMFPLEEPTDPKQAALCLEYTGARLYLYVHFNFQGDAKSLPLANMINNLWSPVRNHGYNVLVILNSHLTMAGCQVFLTALEVKYFFIIHIWATKDINERKKKQLKEQYEGRYLGNLLIS